MFAYISIRYGSTPQGLQIPRAMQGFRPPFGGQPPKTKIYEKNFHRPVTSTQNDSRGTALHNDRGRGPLRPRKISMGLCDFFCEIGDFFDFFDVPKRRNFDPLQGART